MPDKVKASGDYNINFPEPALPMTKTLSAPKLEESCSGRG